MNTLMLNNLNHPTPFNYLYEAALSVVYSAMAMSLMCIVAAILKVSYVLRCIAQHGLGQEVR